MTSTRRSSMTAAAAAVVLAVVVTGCSSTAQGAPTPTTETTTATVITPIPAPPTPSAAPAGTTPVATAPAMPTGTPGRPRGLPTTAVDTTSIDAVAKAFASTTFTYDTALDRSEFDAQVRSSVYATPAFAAELTTPLAQTGSATFTTLAAHQGFTTVTLALNADDGQPPDELRSAARSYRVTITGQGTTGLGTGGWSAPLDATTIYLRLARTGASAPWQIASVSFGLGR